MQDNIADDIVTGCEAIGAFIGADARRTHYLLTNGLIAGAFKEGKVWRLLKSVYVADVRAKASQSAAPAKAKTRAA